MYKQTIITVFLLGLGISLFSQTITRPNYGLKSHPTLEIESVVLSNKSVTLFMAIENQVIGGEFCADKNIFIILPDGRKIKLKSAEGIPRCPETHKFKASGEKLHFTLHFPSIPDGTLWMDLVEDCDDACFSFNSIILDASLNQKIDHAYSLMEALKMESAYMEFEELLNNFSLQNCSYEGAIYWNLATISGKLGNKTLEKEWLDKLVKSNIPQKERYIESLMIN